MGLIPAYAANRIANCSYQYKGELELALESIEQLANHNYYTMFTALHQETVETLRDLGYECEYIESYEGTHIFEVSWYAQTGNA